jgi:hypothetical protein
LTCRNLFLATMLSATWMTAQSTAPVTEWVRANAIRLTTPEAGHGFADMEPLKKVVGNARIVSLGEATHGSREFFQLKHRMMEFLATQMGFTIFSIEANMPESHGGWPSGGRVPGVDSRREVYSALLRPRGTGRFRRFP